MSAQNGGQGEPGKLDFDVVVVGAGFAGLYMLYRLRALGFSATVIESADDVGGTWYWNRYPGARCDIESIDYSYSFDPALQTEWQWSERYATQPEILRYLGYVADKHDLRRDIRFSTRVESAAWDGAAKRWRVRTDRGDELRCRFYVMATGCLSLPKTPDIEGVARFRGETYYTNRWPHAGVDFSGKRVAVIGTGSSGIQSIPIIARQAAELTVFQRTPNFSRPAFNGPVAAEKKARFDADPAAYREAARWSRAGVPAEPSMVRTFQVSERERLAKYEEAYASGDLLALGSTFADLGADPRANETVCDFMRGKIRSIVRDPATAETLCPNNHFYGTKRPCIDTNYFETFNLPHVHLVDLRKDPIRTITETGIDTASRSFTFDAIVFATGFDAMTGAIVAVDIKGRDGVALARKWAEGPRTYLGLMTSGFPNFFTITGPGSPSVLSNMVVSIEQHVDWIGACLAHMRAERLDAVEPTPVAEAGWVQHVNDCGDITLFPRADSWYMGANVPGKPRVFLPYVGGVDRYRKACDEVVGRGYLGFAFDGPGGARCNDGVVNRLQLDVAMVLELMAGLGLPPIESLSAADARALWAATAIDRPPGPDVGDVADGVLRGAAGPLVYRRYRPSTPGPHPIVVYFHGGGWVLGGLDSDDPFCRDLCVRSDAVVVSVDYRHAPEARFPAAVDDGFAAVRWIAANADALGGDASRLAVCGWSAGGNIAAVVCQMARDAGGPPIAGQVLVTPAVGCDFTRPSYVENADGYVLTISLMHWFWDHYADPADRQNPKASPIRARDLSGLPPALVVTCEFDPLRDEGAAYAEALAGAGVEARHLPCRGQIHTSVPAVDVILSAAGAREEIGAALRRFLGAAAPVERARRIG
ncbi:MAG TPA: alpha/beta hydrolase fold domain-containing protein [Candidatus Eisenbacteria bacterium]|nr:alpha/beta hydrolase fold domain-containing protein [Candidatus Eisenbacteria bacterium]